MEFPLEQAEVEPGKWLRRPACCGECSSTTSRDMQMGLLLYSVWFGRSDLLQRLWRYGWRHLWKMGDETRTEELQMPILGTIRIRNNRTWYTPGLVVLLAACLAHTRGHRKLAKVLTYFPQAYSTAPGYVSHLTLLHLLLNLIIRGRLTERERRTLKAIQKHMWENPLVWALLGYPNIARVFLNARWPQDFFTTRTWSEPWALQRSDTDSGLERGANPAEYQANWDYLFAKNIIDKLC